MNMTSKPFTALTERYGKPLIIFAWLCSTLLYLNIFGLVTHMEAGKYIEEAERFVKNGAFSAPRYWFYSVTLFIMILALKLKIGMTGAFIIQALLNLFAYLLFYKALKKIFKNPATALLVIIYLLAFWFYQNWIVFLYTESAFFSLVLILFSVTVLYKPTSVKNLLLLGSCLLLLILSRPLGILFAGSVYLYLFYCASKKWKIILAACSVLLIAAAYFSINAVFSSLSDWRITQAFEQESIICDLPAAGPYQKLDLAPGGTPVYHLWYYLTHNFSHFIHFAGVKLQYFFLMTRTYYTNGHNYFLLLNMVLLYLLAAIGFFFKHPVFRREIAVFLLGTILLYALTIIFQCDDYHNRFVLSIFPFFVILAARTVDYFASGLFKYKKEAARAEV